MNLDSGMICHVGVIVAMSANLLYSVYSQTKKTKTFFTELSIAARIADYIHHWLIIILCKNSDTMP
jgi:hypothetical protein